MTRDTWPGYGGGAVYGYESSCPEGVDQNTALLATAAAIGNTGKYITKIFI